MLAKVNSGGVILFLEGNCSNLKGQTLEVEINSSTIYGHMHSQLKKF